MRVLVLGITASPFEVEYQIHYSVHKIFGTATGFADLGHETFLMAKKDTSMIEGVQLKPYSTMDKEFINSMDLIVFTIEGGVEKCIKASSGLTWLFEERVVGNRHHPKIVSKMGKHTWMSKTPWNLRGCYDIFDYFFMQEVGFASAFNSAIGDIDNKIFVSKMGVPKKIVDKPKLPPFEKSKYNLLYMGRMRQTPSKMPFMINMMNLLGDNFKLIILPGTFSKPGFKGRNKFGPQTPENFKWLQDFFSPATNIDVHYPVNWGQHWKYLQHADLGIDFAPHHKVRKYPAGNAKLLEYMTAGLPSITEENSGNSELIEIASGGLILNQGSSPNNYAAAIKKSLSMRFDRPKISKITIKNNNWELRAEEMLLNMELS